MYPIRLTGATVVLREFSADDAAAAYAIDGDERVTRWLSFDAKTPEQSQQTLVGVFARARLEPRTEFYLAVALADSDRLIGFVRLGLAGVKAGKLGYAIRSDEWGRGYATDAARTMISFGFQDLHLHRISAAIGPDNAASITVVERLGFQYEGQLRDHVYTNGAWRDSLLYSILAPEWPTSNVEVSARGGQRAT